MMKKIIYFFLIINVYSQEKPAEFFASKIEELSFAIGSNWNVNTTFGPMRFQDYKFDKESKFSDSLSIKISPGLLSRNDNISLYFYEHITFKKYFYS